MKLTAKEHKLRHITYSRITRLAARSNMLWFRPVSLNHFLLSGSVAVRSCSQVWFRHQLFSSPAKRASLGSRSANLPAAKPSLAGLRGVPSPGPLARHIKVPQQSLQLFPEYAVMPLLLSSPVTALYSLSAGQ